MKIDSLIAQNSSHFWHKGASLSPYEPRKALSYTENRAYVKIEISPNVRGTTNWTWFGILLEGNWVIIATYNHYFKTVLCLRELCDNKLLMLFFAVFRFHSDQFAFKNWVSIVSGSWAVVIVACNDLSTLFRFNPRICSLLSLLCAILFSF